MGKHVIYVRARDEKELEAAGHDPGDWVRDVVKNALEERTVGAREGVGRVTLDSVRIDGERREVTPDFRGKDLK